jgi:hypothetical protein
MIVGSLAAVSFSAVTLAADVISVRHIEDTVHGFLVLRSMDGTTIASGDLIRTLAGPR